MTSGRSRILESVELARRRDARRDQRSVAQRTEGSHRHLVATQRRSRSHCERPAHRRIGVDDCSLVPSRPYGGHAGVTTSLAQHADRLLREVATLRRSRSRSDVPPSCTLRPYGPRAARRDPMAVTQTSRRSRCVRVHGMGVVATLWRSRRRHDEAWGGAVGRPAPRCRDPIAVTQTLRRRGSDSPRRVRSGRDPKAIAQPSQPVSQRDGPAQRQHRRDPKGSRAAVATAIDFRGVGPNPSCRDPKAVTQTSRLGFPSRWGREPSRRDPKAVTQTSRPRVEARVGRRPSCRDPKAATQTSRLANER